MSAPVADIPATKRNRRWLRLVVIAGCAAVAAWLLRPVAVDFCEWRARDCLDERAHERALFWLRCANFLKPQHAETQYLLAKASRRLSRFDDVRKHLEQAHALGWDQRQLEREQRIALAQTGQYAAVREHWPELLRDAGADGPEICNAYVSECLLQLQLQDALAVLTAWEQDFPADPQPHFMRARVWESQRKWSAAQMEFAKTLDLAPDRTDARYQLARTLMRELRFADAEPHLARCVREQPANADASVALAVCLQKLDRAKESRELLERQLAKTPDHVEALRTLAELDVTAGQSRAAVEHLRHAVRLEPVDGEIRFAFATALEAAGETEAARKELAFVAEATKPLLRLSKLTEDLMRDPRNADLRYEIGEITWRYKSRTEGARWFHSLLELAPRHTRAHRALAEHYRLLGKTELANEHARLADASVP